MNVRIQYIDELKGIAIFLMVMGHVISNQFSDFHAVLGNSDSMESLVWRIIYSFHMPLFMFCSGLVCKYCGNNSLIINLSLVFKRFKTLIIPFFCVGGIRYYLFQGHFLDYWYLWMLFFFIVLTMLIDSLSATSKYYAKNISSVLLIVLAIVCQLWYSKLFVFESKPFIDIGHLSLFPYFCMGVVVGRYDLLSKRFLSDWSYTISLCLFLFLTYWITIKGNTLPKFVLTKSILPISAIISLVYLCKYCINHSSRYAAVLQDLGKHSLEIYLIHFFFLFKMDVVGNYIHFLSESDGGGRTIFVFQIVSSILASVIIVGFSYLTMNIINKSRELSVILLGRKMKDDEGAGNLTD